MTAATVAEPTAATMRSKCRSLSGPGSRMNTLRSPIRCVLVPTAVNIDGLSCVSRRIRGSRRTSSPGTGMEGRGAALIAPDSSRLVPSVVPGKDDLDSLGPAQHARLERRDLAAPGPGLCRFTGGGEREQAAEVLERRKDDRPLAALGLAQRHQRSHPFR